MHRHPQISLEKRQLFYVGAGPYLIKPAQVYTFRAYHSVAPHTTYFTEERMLQPFAAGICLNAGYQVRKDIFVSAYFQGILTNMASKELRADHQDLSDFRIYNYGLSVGYLFELKKKAAPKQNQ